MSRALLICVVGLLVLAGGCGGDEDESAGEAWAGDFCSAAGDWRATLDEIVGQFQSPSDLSADSVRGAVDDGLDATQTFLDELDSLGSPETEGGQEAAEIVDSMKSTIQTTADDLRGEFESDTDSLPELLAKLGQASGDLEQMVQELQGSLQQLETLELGDALETNEDCEAAQAGSG